MNKDYFEQIKTVSAEFWKLFKKYYESLSDKDEFWDALIKEFGDTARKYKGTEVEAYAEKMMIMYLDELQTRCKKGDRT